jgi:5-oxoprolinase (ATP-hydrolysing)/N-methylhydantoinase A
MWPTSAANTSIELFESRTPALVLEKAYRSDSGGAGRQRGGLGQIVRFRKLTTDGRTTLAGVWPEGVGVAYEGLFAGRPGGNVTARVVSNNGVDDLGTGRLVVLNRDDEVVEIRLGGGAGFGDALTRTYDRIDHDLAHGYVTREGAERDYGCVVVDDKVDRSASDARRASLRQAAE